MPTWQQVFDRSKRRYGLATGAEDGLLVDALFLERVNELLEQMAAETKGFRTELTLNLATTAALALSEDVVQVIEGSVRIDYDDDGVYELEPTQIPERTLRRAVGPLENVAAGPPEHYYTQRGATAGATLNLALFPRSAAAVTNGVKLWAAVVPEALAAPDSTIPLQRAEVRFLIPGICLALAEVEFNRGAEGAAARVRRWDAAWKAALVEFGDLVEDGERGETRRVGYEGME